MNPLEHIMGVEEASELWGLQAGYIKNLCAEEKIKAIKIGKTWILDRNQPNPSQKSIKQEELIERLQNAQTNEERRHTRVEALEWVQEQFDEMNATLKSMRAVKDNV